MRGRGSLGSKRGQHVGWGTGQTGSGVQANMAGKVEGNMADEVQANTVGRVEANVAGGVQASLANGVEAALLESLVPHTCWLLSLLPCQPRDKVMVTGSCQHEATQPQCSTSTAALKLAAVYSSGLRKGLPGDSCRGQEQIWGAWDLEDGVRTRGRQPN